MRQLVRQYKVATAREELEAAAALLRAAGIGATIELPESGLPLTFDQVQRDALRSVVGALLNDDAPGHVLVRAVTGPDGLRLEARRAGGDRGAGWL